MDERLGALLDEAAHGSKRLVALTGAGISAESGIPTFRGKEGYWTVGSREYHPQELATLGMFSREPESVWPWYLYRRGVCRAAGPNDAHHALVRLEAAFPGRFVLVTQNVDGLHLRAGSSLERTWQIHGNVDTMRCYDECSVDLYPIPDGLDPWPRGRELDHESRALLVCPRCGGISRPHVLWFDEFYDEPRYRFESSHRAAEDADLLLVVGTAGATNLPNQMARAALHAGAVFVDVNPEDNVFAQLARRVLRGAWVQDSATAAVPEIVDRLIAAS